MSAFIKGIAVLCVGLSFSAGAATAQDQSKPITIVVPFGAGGSTDVMARILAGKMQIALKRSVIVDNKPGAGGRLAAGVVKNMPADGSVILVGLPAQVVVAPYLYPGKLNYDFQRDYTPVAKLVKLNLSLAVPASSNFKDLKSFLSYAKNNPGKVNYGTSGVGGIPHLVGYKLAKVAHIDWTMVPFKGGSQVNTDLMAGHIDASIDTIADHIDQHAAGKVRILGVFSPARLSVVPEVPTLKEMGFEDVDAEIWQGFFVPAKTPLEVVKSLQDAVAAVLNDADTRARFNKLGMQVDFKDSSAFSGQIRRESEKWGTLIRQDNIKVE